MSLSISAVTPVPSPVKEIDPCSPSPCGTLAECKEEDDLAVCKCITGFFGDPYVQCHPECSTDSHCSNVLACVNDKCIDPCPGTCGINAECRVSNHVPICTCPPSYQGNPYQRCYSRPEKPDDDMCDVCGPNAECHLVGKRPVCTCYPGFFGAPPNCRPECINNRHCQTSLACINQKCIDPCPGACGTNAECRVSNHSPVCSCAPGYTGEPFVRCINFTTGEMPKPPQQPSDPCREETCAVNANCHVEGNRGICTCIPGYFGNPYAQCRPECVINSECPQYLACNNQRCTNPCPGTCGIDAICEVVHHNPICTCPRSMTGNPFTRCEPIRDPLDLCNPTPCGPYTKCQIIVDRAVCYCIPGYSGNPDLGCKPECTINSDCPLSKACVNIKCVDPCIGICGTQAQCSVVSHNPLCSCPDDYTGDPLIACRPKPTAPLDPCNPDPCGINANCDVSNNRAVCKCLSSYFGNPYVECRPECIINSDCPKYLACNNQKCRDPCPGTCSIEAVCDVINHNATCSCPRGYTGDPYVRCKLDEPDTPKPECFVDDECSDSLACIELQCQDPCALYENCAPNAVCHVTRHRPVCSCPDGYVGNPNIQCIVAGCRSDSECPVLQACINRDCDDPCEYADCGINAECRVINHRAHCYCPEKFLGDPYIHCERPECTDDPECPSWFSCIDQQCQDPCNCGPNAECRVINHRPQCTCPPEYEGNPLVECTPRPHREPPKECQTDGDCPSKLACFSGSCDDPCLVIKPCGVNAKCNAIDTLPFRTMTCECLPGFIGNAYLECTPRPTEPPGCSADDECGPTELCRNRQCLDPCAILNPCSPNAECQVLNRRPECTCPPGHTGNPRVFCHQILLEPECRQDPDCPSDEACINDICIDPCLVDNQCGLKALCRTQQHRPICYCPEAWAGNPQIECFKPECTVDEECPMNKACINQNCVNPCTYLGPACGLNAKCRAVIHRAQCYCPVGMQGNPSIACVAVGCTSSYDCADDKACDRLNRVCIPVCETSTCGAQAECKAANHAAMCVCPPTFTGNPYLQCFQVQEPPVVVTTVAPECRQDPDCPSQEACINSLCRNPCTESSPCFPSQECRVVDGSPFISMVCECPPDQILVKDGICIKPGVVEPECHYDIDCDGHEYCEAGTCMPLCRKQPCGLNAVCSAVNHRRFCTCAPGYAGDPYTGCKMPPESEETIPECVTDDQCSDSLSCINKRCVSPCMSNNPCAPHAFCYVRDHRPVCRCPGGYVGDPKIECRPSE
ncbi:hypothetical protein SK128_022665 [Halocaridina rubra]|uniref:EGF-like domain-containing protein n=1 Tax=Halocaridina rubra TaxID=373956 RepID=A0AAN8X308_HALRR